MKALDISFARFEYTIGHSCYIPSGIHKALRLNCDDVSMYIILVLANRPDETFNALTSSLALVNT